MRSNATDLILNKIVFFAVFLLTRNSRLNIQVEEQHTGFPHVLENLENSDCPGTVEL